MTTRALTALAMILLSGCSFFKRPPNQFYSLDTIPGTAAAAVSGTPVGIDGIELPPGLDRRGIVLRDEKNKLEVRGTHQWASSLEDMVIHTLAFDLASRLPEGMVVLPGQAKPAAMRSVHVLFEELSPGPDNIFVLDARWTIGPAAANHHERIEITMPSDDSTEVVNAMNQALAALADRMVMSLSRA
jgi:uncharacterized lipoprotein YmbA